VSDGRAGIQHGTELDSRREVTGTQIAWAEHPSWPYTIPFIVFMVLLAGQQYLAFLGAWEPPLRAAVLIVVLWGCSRHVIDLRVRSFAPTVLIGITVFVIWIAPDLLYHGYRNHWLFQNSITGRITSTLTEDMRSNPVVLISRAFRAVILVPIIEELFWRAWFLRWLINADFRNVSLGTYTASSLLISSLLFASEHGPYWDVGLLAGFIYNWWMIRTKSLGDCILAHAVTNGVLSAYVVATGQWPYWM
jgi:CAAX prenyl protease-like protein